MPLTGSQTTLRSCLRLSCSWTRWSSTTLQTSGSSLDSTSRQTLSPASASYVSRVERGPNQRSSLRSHVDLRLSSRRNIWSSLCLCRSGGRKWRREVNHPQTSDGRVDAGQRSQTSSQVRWTNQSRVEQLPWPIDLAGGSSSTRFYLFSILLRKFLLTFNCYFPSDGDLAYTFFFPQKPEDWLLQSASRGPARPQRLLCGASA